MAHDRTKQRGMASAASSAILAALGLLLGVAGCSSDESSGSGGAERLGRVGQALCGINPSCPEDSDCGDWTCSKLNNGTCTVVAGAAKNGEPCKTFITSQIGLCLGSACCTGCIEKDKLTGALTCRPGNTVANCGIEGNTCDNCNLGNSCDMYQCDPGKGVCITTAIEDRQPCNGEPGACWNNSCCGGCIDANNVCQLGNTVGQCGLSSVGNSLVSCQSCDDGNVCNNDSCQNGVCAAPTPKPGSCSDNNKCNGDEMCANGQCGNPPDLVCNDNNPCTVDSCDPATGCVFTPKEVGTSCDDATVCNGVSKCELNVQGAIFCKPGTAPDCDDNNICTTDACDPAAGCKYTNNTVDCSDNDLCTLVDKCAAGKCVGTGVPNCNDNEDCTTDTCQPAKGCVNSAKADTTPCDDGNACTDNDQCVGAKCFGSGKQCDDMNTCTQNTCNPQTQACSNPAETNGTPCTFDRCHQNSTCQAGACDAGVTIDCDDNNPCTTDSCVGATGCKHVNVDGGDCSDADLCTTADKCKAGACVGTAVTCTPLDDCHVAGTCNPNSGSCDDPRAPDDTECDGGDGTCDTGKCIPNPTGGAGAGAGGAGEPGAGGDGTGTGGTAVVPEGGEPSVPAGGDGNGNEPGAGGTPGGPGKGGTSTTGGTDVQVGGEGIDPDKVFVRDPGGCACSVPSSGSSNAGWLAGFALVASAAAARRRRQLSARRA